MIPITGETDCRVLNFNFWQVLCYDVKYEVGIDNKIFPKSEDKEELG